MQMAVETITKSGIGKCVGRVINYLYDQSMGGSDALFAFANSYQGMIDCTKLT